MATYGPYYPTSVVSEGSPAWSNPQNAQGEPDGNKASCDLGSGEGVTGLLRFTDFNADVAGTVQSARFVVTPAGAIAGPFDASTKDMVGAGDPVELSRDSNSLRAEDDIAPTAAQVNGDEFGLSLSCYGSGGGVVEIESVALYVETE